MGSPEEKVCVEDEHPDRTSTPAREQAVRVENTQLGFDCLINLLTRNNLALLILFSRSVITGGSTD